VHKSMNIAAYETESWMTASGTTCELGQQNENEALRDYEPVGNCLGPWSRECKSPGNQALNPQDSMSSLESNDRKTEVMRSVVRSQKLISERS